MVCSQKTGIHLITNLSRNNNVMEHRNFFHIKPLICDKHSPFLIRLVLVNIGARNFFPEIDKALEIQVNNSIKSEFFIMVLFL